MATEKRLIDANPLATGVALYVAENAYLNDTALDVLKKVSDWVNDAPTVDAVEVVRCRKCQHWQKKYETKGICLKHNAIATFTAPDFYCACGERRTKK